MKDKSRGRNRRHRRRVAVVTGTRAEYGLLRTTIEAIAAHPNLRLQLVVAGIHLLRRFGSTFRQIEKDGFRIGARVRMQRGTDDPSDQSAGLARGVSGMAAYFERAKTDIVLVLGDRIEAMAGALAATTTGRFLAHVHGGDIAPGDMDDLLRHSITKLAHVHLAASRDAARRIIRLGEAREHVHIVGAPGMDRIYALLRETPRAAREDRAIVLLHAQGRAAAIEGRTLKRLLRAVRAHHLDIVVIYPNTDRGHSGIIEAIDGARRDWGTGRNSGGLRVVRSLARDDYLRLLIRSRLLVGNSSSGIIESAVAGIPCVNVGARQDGRLRGGRLVYDCGESYQEMREAVGRALRLRPKNNGTTPYGEEGAGRRIAAILADTPLNETIRRKRITF